MPATTVTAVSPAAKEAFHKNVEAIFKVIVFTFNEQWRRAVL
jgi:hypothetical protein